MSAIYQLKWHGHVATAETLFTICPAAGLKLYHSRLIFLFSLAALQIFLHPVPPRKSICMDYSNESPCPLLPGRSHRWAALTEIRVMEEGG